MLKLVDFECRIRYPDSATQICAQNIDTDSFVYPISCEFAAVVRDLSRMFDAYLQHFLGCFRMTEIRQICHLLIIFETLILP